jgi:MSHA biogenesis protein MshJ
MNTNIKALKEKYNVRSLRERVLIAGAIFAVIYFSWYNLLYSYFLATDEEVSKNLQNIKSQIGQLEQQIDSMSEVVGRNPTATLIMQSKNLKADNEVLNQKIHAYIKKMVPPTEMDTLLNNIIQKASGLTVLSIENLEVKPLFESKEIDLNGKSSGFQVFNHGVKFQLQGTYTLRFLKALEQQKLNVIWNSFSYEVIKYPKAKITLELNTLSLEEALIGV